MVAAHTDHALDQGLLAAVRQQTDEFEALADGPGAGLGGFGQPPLGVVEDHDVPAVDVTGLGTDDVDEDAVVQLEGLLHGARGDVVAAHQEGLDHEGDDHGERHDDQDLPHRAPSR
ncbi:hypothetical protein ACJ65_01035 [Kocuria rhizophila]|nr:hypothetical protein ACJ65_01035 [Kocuria rhizophila]